MSVEDKAKILRVKNITRSLQSCHLFLAHSFHYVKIPSTKTELHNIVHRCQRKTKLRPLETRRKFSEIWTCALKYVHGPIYRQPYRHAAQLPKPK